MPMLQSIRKIKERTQADNELQQQLKALLEYVKRSEEEKKGSKVYLHVRKDHRIVLVKTTEIAYVKASGNYCEVFLPDHKHLIREGIGRLEKMLPSQAFLRIHRSTLVNIHFIHELIHTPHGELDVRLVEGTTLRVSRTYQENLLKKIELK